MDLTNTKITLITFYTFVLGIDSHLQDKYETSLPGEFIFLVR